eukprot:1139641-Pelagomonas_calceolata.AAC.2
MPVNRLARLYWPRQVLSHSVSPPAASLCLHEEELLGRLFPGQTLNKDVMAPLSMVELGEEH